MTVETSFSDSVLKLPFKPVKSNVHNHGVDEDWRAEEGAQVNEYLLKCVQGVDVDSVQSRLRGGARGEEESVDVGHVDATAIDDDGIQYGHANDAVVMNLSKARSLVEEVFPWSDQTIEAETDLCGVLASGLPQPTKHVGSGRRLNVECV